MSICELSAELLQEIAFKIPSENKHLRATCKYINSAIAPLFFSSIILDLQYALVKKSVVYLEALSTGKSAWSPFARTLTIRRLSPTLELREWNGGHEYLGDIEHGSEPEMELLRYRMPGLVKSALCCLPNLQNVSWRIRTEDDTWIIHSVTEILVSLPSLDSLHLDVDRSAFDKPLQLTQLSGLRKLTLITQSSNSLANVLQPMAVAISNSPELASLHLKGRSDEFHAESPSIQHLLSACSLTKPLRLTGLHLDSYGLRLDSAIIPHLRTLRSFSLHRNMAHTESLQTKSDPPLPSAAATEKLCSTSQEVWGKGIHLADISVDQIEDGLLSYLASYSGLERLSIAYAGANTAAKSDQLAEMFFDKGLVPHVESLAELYVPASFEGRWCFGKHNAAIISQIRKLRSLCMSIVTLEGGGNDEDAGSNKSRNANIDLFLETIIMHFPALRYAELRSANGEMWRDDWCGTSMMMCRAEGDKEIESAVMDIRLRCETATSMSMALVKTVKNLYMLERDGDVLVYRVIESAVEEQDEDEV
ncbi:hypothetical protein B0H19DRAFT_1374352 [Mycena capillaripes]|nr:hypothetical protein B0H19DRAFT_1374352 [Mycena capillaripes]